MVPKNLLFKLIGLSNQFNCVIKQKSEEKKHRASLKISRDTRKNWLENYRASGNKKSREMKNSSWKWSTHYFYVVYYTVLRKLLIAVTDMEMTTAAAVAHYVHSKIYRYVYYNHNKFFLSKLTATIILFIENTFFKKPTVINNRTMFYINHNSYRTTQIITRM